MDEIEIIIYDEFEEGENEVHLRQHNFYGRNRIVISFEQIKKLIDDLTKVVEKYEKV
jgi:hypothetical protein